MVMLHDFITDFLTILCFIQGNGSEEGCKEDETLFFGSTHEKDNYPGTGNDPTPFIGDNVRNTIHRRIVNRYLSSGPKSRY